jgi:thiosulfate/3-mercaptopyruvate sulfurtransferase
MSSMTAIAAEDVLISAGELAGALASAAPPILLDVRWVDGQVDLDGYLLGHLPGAVFLDLDADLAAPPGIGGRHPLPAAADLEAVWRRAGIDDTSSVVVYDSGNCSIAARAWWLLRWSGRTDVRVLDGGMAGWAADPTRLTESGPERAPVPGSMAVVPGGMPTVDADRAREITLGEGTLLDARAPVRYRGEVEPIDPMAGHIPGSVNLPFTDLLAADGTFLGATEIAAVFDGVLGPPDSDESGEVAASCGSGVTACHLILAAATIGRSIALYAGSYSGWLALGRPVSIGPGAPTGR